VTRERERSDRDDGAQGRGRAHGETLAAISRGIVQLHRQYYGKGPTKAKTYAMNDTLVCMLSGGFTTAEQTLIREGKSEDVESLRRSFQRTMKGRFTAVVEEATGRTVVAYMSQVHTSPNLAVELFVLEPDESRLLGEYEHDEGAGATG
jgi:uncharacterized protein YbcI